MQGKHLRRPKAEDSTQQARVRAGGDAHALARAWPRLRPFHQGGTRRLHIALHAARVDVDQIFPGLLVLAGAPALVAGRFRGRGRLSSEAELLRPPHVLRRCHILHA